MGNLIHMEPAAVSQVGSSLQRLGDAIYQNMSSINRSVRYLDWQSGSHDKYLAEFEKNGMKAVGKNPKTGLVEIVELTDHPFYIGSQFHPELKSTVEHPHPLFVQFIAAALKYAHNRKIKNGLEELAVK